MMYDVLFLSRVRVSGGPYVTLENMTAPRPKVGYTCAVRIKDVTHGKIAEYYTTITEFRGSPIIRIPDGLGGFESGDNVVMSVLMMQIDREWFLSDLSVGMAEYRGGESDRLSRVHPGKDRGDTDPAPAE